LCLKLEELMSMGGAMQAEIIRKALLSEISRLEREIEQLPPWPIEGLQTTADSMRRGYKLALDDVRKLVKRVCVE
jgi:hypothetical protein